MIDERLRYGLSFVEDVQLLMGSGTGQNLAGIYTTATAYVAPITISGATDIDILRLAFLQGELALLPADAVDHAAVLREPLYVGALVAPASSQPACDAAVSAALMAE